MKIAFKCKLCGKDGLVSRYRYKESGNYCSASCAGKDYKGNKSPKWKNGKFIHPNGYIYITTPENHPLRLRGYRYIAEHRLKMEKKLGRFLNKNELIHHLNGTKLDNRIINLALCTRRNHYEFIKQLQERIRELENQ